MKKLLVTLFIIILTTSLFAGCGKSGSSSPVVSWFVKLDSNEVLQIDDKICALPEAMLVLMSEQNKYKEILGTDGWDTQIGDTTVKEYVLNIVEDKLSVVYALCAMAEDEDIELTVDEAENAANLAKEFYESLNENEIDYTGATEEDAVNLVKNCVLAKKVYDTVADKNMTVEISDEQARVIEIQYVYETDKDKIDSIYKKSQNENQDFLLLAEMYSQDDTVQLTLKRGETTEKFEEVAFLLNTDELSDVFETDDGYYIIKCTNSYLQNETSANKAQLESEAKEKCVSQIYDEFIDKASSIFNDSVWKNIEFSDNENVTSTAFNNLFTSICGETKEE